jgi:hypothetical protein
MAEYTRDDALADLARDVLTVVSVVSQGLKAETAHVDHLHPKDIADAIVRGLLREAAELAANDFQRPLSRKDFLDLAGEAFDTWQYE